MSHSVTQVVNAPLRSNDFYCEFDQSGTAVPGATAAVNMTWREDVTLPLFFRSSTLTLLTTSAPTHGHFILYPGFARTKKTRWRPLELNDRSLRLHEKIGDCEQSSDAFGRDRVARSIVRMLNKRTHGKFGRRDC